MTPSAALGLEHSGSLYEHCIRALERGTRLGPHGLPLMGSGDWNDGMNRVGAEGRGESVWLAWFLADCLRRFAGDRREPRGRRSIGPSIAGRPMPFAGPSEAHAWDGSWYLRAFFDDGTPLGSARADECQIDSIAQSWGVISACRRPGAEPEGHAVRRRPPRAQGRRADSACLHLRSTTARSTPATSRAICQASARTAPSTPTRPPGWCRRSPCSVRGALPTICSRSSTRFRTASDRDLVHSYKVEPYVVAGDVYSLPPHVGRGGWTWYTGSAGWLYRVGLESILGIHRIRRLASPRSLSSPPLETVSRSRTASDPRRTTSPSRTRSDWREVSAGFCSTASLAIHATVPLVDDRQAHQIRVVLGNV